MLLAGSRFIDCDDMHVGVGGRGAAQYPQVRCDCGEQSTEPLSARTGAIPVGVKT